MASHARITAVVVAAFSALSSAASSPKHLLFVVVDDLGFDVSLPERASNLCTCFVAVAARVSADQCSPCSTAQDSVGHATLVSIA